MTLAERKLWQIYLRQFPLPVYRQKPIDNYIVDFYIPKLKITRNMVGALKTEPPANPYD